MTGSSAAAHTRPARRTPARRRWPPAPAAADRRPAPGDAPAGAARPAPVPRASRRAARGAGLRCARNRRAARQDDRQRLLRMAGGIVAIGGGKARHEPGRRQCHDAGAPPRRPPGAIAAAAADGRMQHGQRLAGGQAGVRRDQPRARRLVAHTAQVKQLDGAHRRERRRSDDHRLRLQPDAEALVDAGLDGPGQVITSPPVACAARRG